jgi:miniconductance mechanosensitive channel
MRSFYKFLLEYIREIDEISTLAKPGAVILTLLLIFLITWLSYYLMKLAFTKIIAKIILRTKTTWDDILVRRKVFNGIAHIAPAFILYLTANFSYPEINQDISQLSDSTIEMLSRDYYFSLAGILSKIASIYFVFIFIYLSNSLLNSGLDIYNTTPYAHTRPVKGYIQLFKILIFTLSGILIIAILIERDPTVLLAGLGAMGAVLILVFKDTILGFVASIQLSGNNMIKIGDWVEMPARGADGTVIDITLNTVKVQNWDKTISTIPTYAMVSESFTNWRGMEESGGRRIKRSVNIDMNSIKLCNSSMLKKFEKFLLIKDYVREKEKEIKEYNKRKNISDEDLISGRRQTNVGIFRKYLEVYLHQHPKINDDMTFLVRHLNPTDRGLPMEIYVFCKDKSWPVYESVQADIFDHILAVIPEFELRVFQVPSGTDVTNVLSKFSA